MGNADQAFARLDKAVAYKDNGSPGTMAFGGLFP
jgi:hypothetical protein